MGVYIPILLYFADQIPIKKPAVQAGCLLVNLFYFLFYNSETNSSKLS